MRLRLPFSVAVMVGLASVGCGAQEAAPMHAPDGTSWEHVQSIDIPSMTNAPFTATVTTELTKMLPDQTTVTSFNHRTVSRDGAGRVFQERRYFAPHGDVQMTRISELDYVDPNRHTLTICHPATETCEQHRYTRQAMPVGQQTPQAMPATTMLANGRGTVERSGLGEKEMESLQTVGSREVITLNAGAVGNQQVEPIVKEFWYAPTLGINVVTKRFDPRSGMENFVVSHINLSEPDPKMFEVPEGYRVVKVD